MGLSGTRLLLVLLLALALPGGLKAASLRLIRPSDTDPAIGAPDYHHVALAPVGTPRHQLFVFLPGTGGVPIGYDELLQVAAEAGFHVIGLTYENELPVNAHYCPLTVDPKCHENVRIEILEGVDVSDLIAVSRQDSVEHRAHALVRYLDLTYPEENWWFFLDQVDSLVWERTAVGGHSQGAGHAALLAKRHRLARCLIFAWTDWMGREGRPVDWIFAEAATPLDRWYAFTHDLDASVGFEKQQVTWEALEMTPFGSPVLVDTGDWQNSMSRLYFTQLEPAEEKNGEPNYHGAVAVDTAVPKDGLGDPIYRAVWEAMLMATPAYRPGLRPSSGGGAAQFEVDALAGYAFRWVESTDLLNWETQTTVYPLQSDATFQGSLEMGEARFGRLEVDGRGFEYRREKGPFSVEQVDELWFDEVRERALPVRLYLPVGRDGPAPAVIFSHGLGGSEQGSSYFAEHFASWGYVLLHPSHPGSDQQFLIDNGLAALLAAPLLSENRVNRPEDVRFMVDRLADPEANSVVQGRVDMQRVGVAGHSFGAFTALAAVGQTFEAFGDPHALHWDPRLRACLALSPQGPGVLGLSEDSWSAMQRPFMIQWGTNDVAYGTEYAIERRFSFDTSSRSDRYSVQIVGAQHDAFGDRELGPGEPPRDPRHHGWILQAALAFFDAYLCDQGEALEWLESGALSEITAYEAVLEDGSVR